MDTELLNLLKESVTNNLEIKAMLLLLGFEEIDTSWTWRVILQKGNPIYVTYSNSDNSYWFNNTNTSKKSDWITGKLLLKELEIL